MPLPAPLQDITRSVRAPETAVASLVQQRLDGKTKPRGSLGRLETLACQLAAALGQVPKAFSKAIVVMAADHGVAAEGVSAYPPEVTSQMLANFAAGGAAINVLARQMGARLVVVDMGTLGPPLERPSVLSRRLASGTANFRRGPAMSEAQAARAVQAGVEIARELGDEGINLVGLGEMGIGNTTAASALTSALLGVPARETVGRGTGLDDAALAHKRRVIEEALETNAAATREPFSALAALGGFEIAGLVGVILGAAARRVPVLVDGFITASAALVASRLAPACRGYLVASHRSVEPGHAHLLQALELHPLLQLDLRLGEGTGAALAMPLADAALRIVNEMSSFEQAGVTDTGR